MDSEVKISNVKRLKQIVNAFVKHGFGTMVKIAGLDPYISFGKRILSKKEEVEDKFTDPQRMVMAFEELGPTFIKLGQILSSRRDQIPKEYIMEFEKLTDRVAPLPFEKINMVFESEFGKSMVDAFERVEKEAYASGSIGQVHSARLKSGESVVVKIRKPGVNHIIDVDVKILYFIAHQIKRVIHKENSMINPVDLVKEFERVIKSELDFAVEGRNIERFSHNFQNNPEVHFPKVYWEYSSPCVLVMEKIEGIPVSDVEKLREHGHDLKKIAANLFEMSLKQLFIDAFFHADPHPGNFIIMEGDVIGVIDCGMVGFFEEYVVNAFMDCFVGLFLKDYSLMARGYMAIGSISKEIDLNLFKNDLRNFVEHYMEIPLNSIGIKTLLDDAVDIGVRNKMKIPPTMLFVSKVLISIEGTINKLDPSFDFVSNSARFAKKLVAKKKFEPTKVFSNIFQFIGGISELLQSLPKQTAKILSMIENNEMGFDITLSATNDFYKHLDSYATRISLAMISAGLGVASSIVIQAKIAPLLFDISILGIFGYSMAVVLGLWVVILIIKGSK